MQITNLRPTAAGGTVATFDLELVPGVFLPQWQLRRSGEKWRTFCPATKHGTPSAILPNALRDQITQAAVAAFTGRQAPHDNAI